MHDGLFAADFMADGQDLAALRIVKTRMIRPLHNDLHVLLPGNILVVRFCTLGHEQPQAVCILAQLMQEIPGLHAVPTADLHHAHGRNGIHHSLLREGYMLSGGIEFRATAAGEGVRQGRRIAHEHQPAARCMEGLQARQSRAAQGFTAGHDHHIVSHLAYLQRRAALLIQGGQEGLADEVEINAAQQQPVRDLAELTFQPLTGRVGLFAGPPVQPVALHRMNHAYANHRLAPRHGRIHTGKVILHQRVILPPGGLIVDGSRIVTLGLSLHGDPRQMGHADGHAQRGLPVTMQLMPAEVEGPAGHAVQLAEHAGAAVLMHGGLGLLGRGEFRHAAQVIDAR